MKSWDFDFIFCYQNLFPSDVLHHVAPSVKRNMDWSAMDVEAGVEAEDTQSDDTEDNQSDDSSQNIEEYSSAVTDISADSDVMEDKGEYCEASVRC